MSSLDMSYTIHSKLNSLLFTFLGTLLFIPSITFSLIHAEIFPWAILFVLIYMRKIDKKIFFIILFFLLSIMYGLYVSDGRSYSEAIRSFAAYMNSLLVFTFLIKSKYSFISKLFPIVKFIFFILVILGFLQFFDLIGFLDPLLKLLIPRGSVEKLAFMGDRGVTLLASEPSRAAYEFLFIYVAFRTIFLKQKQFIYYDLFVLIFLLFVIRSGVGFILLMAFFAIFYRLKFIVLLGVLAIVGLPFLDYMSGRAISLLFNMLSSSSFESLYNMLMNASGLRLISIISSFHYGFLKPFGGGMGNWKESSIIALQLTGLDPSNINYFRYNNGGEWTALRPTSYFFSLMLDTGVIGTIVFSMFIYKMLLKYFSFSKYSSNIIIFFLFYLLFAGEVGNPVPFVATALVVKFLQQRMIYDNN